MTSLTLVVPLYNEASRWDEVYWTEVSRIPGLHLVFVNDGNTDTTADLLLNFCACNTGNYLNLPRNVGKSEAIRAGMVKALGGSSELIGYLDADGAFAIEDIEKFHKISLEKLCGGKFHSLWSSRVLLSGRQIQRSLYRQWLSRVVATIIGTQYPSLPYDTQSGFKIFTKSILGGPILRFPFVTRWYLDLELFARAKIANSEFLVWEEPVTSWKDIKGSKISRG
jgi:dolichyl-phosphate beta-glucosyltransferase